MEKLTRDEEIDLINDVGNFTYEELNELKRLREKKSVMITGASKGLGRELAIQFAMDYHIIISGRDAKPLNELSRKIPDTILIPSCDVVVGDLRNKKTLDSLEKIANERDLDILINNAGVYSGSLDEVMATNFTAPVELTKRILPIFLAKKRGLIININSISGKQGSSGELAYSASKHALRGYFDSLRYDVVKSGVRILDIYLGAMDTQMMDWRDDKELLINPKEVAKVVFNNCELYDSLGINEISIGRINYK